MVSELLSKSRHSPDVSAAKGLSFRPYMLQRLPYSACVAVVGEPHPRCAWCRCTHLDSSPSHHWYWNVNDGRGGADAWRRLGWQGAVPPVLVAARQSCLRTAVPSPLKHLKDTGFGEALGAGLFAFEPGLRDVGGSAARVLFGGGVNCVWCGVCTLAGQHRHLGRALRRGRWTAAWMARHEPAQVRCYPRPATSACLPDSPVPVAARQSPRSAPLCRLGPKDRATAAFQPWGWRRRCVDSGTGGAGPRQASASRILRLRDRHRHDDHNAERGESGSCRTSVDRPCD